jgi:hypothetical protein
MGHWEPERLEGDDSIVVNLTKARTRSPVLGPVHGPPAPVPERTTYKTYAVSSDGVPQIVSSNRNGPSVNLWNRLHRFKENLNKHSRLSAAYDLYIQHHSSVHYSPYRMDRIRDRRDTMETWLRNESVTLVYWLPSLHVRIRVTGGQVLTLESVNEE